MDFKPFFFFLEEQTDSKVDADVVTCVLLPDSLTQFKSVAPVLTVTLRLPSSSSAAVVEREMLQFRWYSVKEQLS